MKSIGTTLKKTTNQQMNPYLYYPQYGFGSWLKENAGTIGSVVGAGLGTLIAPGIGTQIGATLGGSIGGSVQQNNATNVTQTEQQNQLNTQAALANYNALNMNAPKYGASFATGGSLNFKSPAAYKAWLAYGHASGEFAKTPGHQKVSIKGQPKKVQHADGGNIGMTGMMKARMALANEFGNKAAQRMVSPNPNTYVFTGKENTPTNEKAGNIGTHYIGSYGNIVRPSIQEINGKMAYTGFPSKRNNEDIKFETPEDAEYFANHYKEIAPMMKSYIIDSLACGGKLKAMGGKLESSDKLDGVTIYKNGGTHEQSPLGGIPVGRLGRVEEGEVRFGNYIFSNRF